MQRLATETAQRELAVERISKFDKATDDEKKIAAGYVNMDEEAKKAYDEAYKVVTDARE